MHDRIHPRRANIHVARLSGKAQSRSQVDLQVATRRRHAADLTALRRFHGLLEEDEPIIRRG